MADLNELFDGLDSKMDFLNEQASKQNNDGIYRVDMSKVKDKKKGYRAVVRFLPNLTKEGTVGQSAIEKISHYVKIQEPKELSGYFDSPRNFQEKCPLTDLYYSLTNSKNAILVERAKLLNYNKKYYSYVLIIEDDQQPELVGRIMIMQYGKTIKDKIMAEKNGDITGQECNVFDLSHGKDFVLVVKEIQTGDETYPDYKMGMFKQDTTSLPIFIKEKSIFKNVPVGEDGKVLANAHEHIKKFLLDREHDLEEFGPKRLTDEQHSKINEIIDFMTGKSTTSYPAKNVASSEDFEFENVHVPTATVVEDEDDFFSDLG